MIEQFNLTKSKPLVAVVDDDLSVRRSWSRLLRSAGYAVQTFGSAQEFLDSCGWQKTRRVRKNSRQSNRGA